MTYVDARAYANSKNNKLSSTDFTESAYLTHQDGTTMFIMNALTDGQDGWTFIFWEHGSPFFFHSEELTYFSVIKDEIDN